MISDSLLSWSHAVKSARKSAYGYTFVWLHLWYFFQISALLQGENYWRFTTDTYLTIYIIIYILFVYIHVYTWFILLPKFTVETSKDRQSSSAFLMSLCKASFIFLETRFEFLVQSSTGTPRLEVMCSSFSCMVDHLSSHFYKTNSENCGATFLSNNWRKQNVETLLKHVEARYVSQVAGLSIHPPAHSRTSVSRR